MNSYFNRLSAAFAIAGLLVIAPVMAMARVPTPANAHGNPVPKKRTAAPAVTRGERAGQSGQHAADKAAP
ncbi:hypothetical protein [Paraburkholderia mimosarum]|uniref:hypothetical protein n=1 Tax=Paraburkholderia mimosarum TaxID=312026 RepID=UPI0012B61796|nr:hypothetical protein [Paraburkholderia mimosarum]